MSIVCSNFGGLIFDAVVPVSILGRKLVGSRGLDSVNPSGDGELSLTLQESRVGRDELLRLCGRKSYMLVMAHQGMRGSVKSLWICRCVGFVSGCSSSFVVWSFALACSRGVKYSRENTDR